MHREFKNSLKIIVFPLHQIESHGSISHGFSVFKKSITR